MILSLRGLGIGLFLLAVSASPSFGQATGVIHRIDGKTVSANEAAAIASGELQRDHVTGAQIAILNHGRVVWTHAFGLRDVERELPMTENTNLSAASITKSVFATWTMRQVEQGLIDLDQPIAQMLPKPLDRYSAFGEAAAGLVRDPQWQRVTPRMMLTHSSGLANLLWLEPDGKLHLHFPPGTRYAYSGVGLMILQLAIEEKLHVELGAAMQQDIFGPLGMSRTGMVWRPEFDEDAALRYDANGKVIGPTHRKSANAAGSMTITIRDLTLFTEAFLGNRLLKPATRAEMLRPQIVIHSAHEFPSLDPSTGSDGEKVGLAYGLGWGLLTRTRFGPAFFKEGHGEGAENYMICFANTGTCMILLTNSDNGELAFRPLLEGLIGDDVTPWEWEGYTRDAILNNEEHSHPK
jgi:CubicO group peptidase (beta-lactamase class C family)